MKTVFHLARVCGQKPSSKARVSLLVLAASIATLSSPATATNLSNKPLATQTSVAVKPNLMFILDNSGSMDWPFMPQDLRLGAGIAGKNDPATPFEAFGYRSAQCNGLAYDPSMVYTPPLTATGVLPPASFTDGRDDGYRQDSGGATHTNLSGSFYYKYSGMQPKQGWVFDAAGVVKDTFYNECLSPAADASGPIASALFTKVAVGPSEAQNYANWYSYYRTRRNLMRTALGQSLASLDAGYRVGLTGISDVKVSESLGYFRDTRDFDTSQRTRVYEALHALKGSETTPLRGALAKVGQYFAKKVPSQTYDPVQYSCQRNYALLTTDGYWNTKDETGTFGPNKLDTTTPVGDQDAKEARPMKDVNGARDTLADISQYYYSTDLRTPLLGNCKNLVAGTDVCANNVVPVGRDAANWQHMTTFTVGLGVSGTFPFDKNYLDPLKKTGTYADLTAGTVTWPVPVASPGEGSTGANIDDLWHAAVNGRGTYYSAMNANALVTAIRDVVATVMQIDGAASAASTSSLELVKGGNNQAYKASYTTEAWTGDLQAYAINDADGVIAQEPSWSAQAKLDLMPAASRNIYFSATNGTRQDFKYANLNATQKGYFDDICAKPGKPDQCSDLDSPNLLIAKDGANLVNYLRGERTYESVVTGSTTISLYRKRAHVLGDIVNGAPVFVGKPPFNYGDSNYAAFVVSQASRKNVVYAAANDGMLHAFSADAADGGAELWAYVPRAVMPNLYTLADRKYASTHQYNVDGAPVMGDISAGGAWKTIMVGGLNNGGRSYYALDITNPLDPKPLWEFTDANLGLSFGNPLIAKRADGTWVVVFASGYNNDTAGGDGVGRLFVLNAMTGAKILDIPTSAGSTTNPSGLAKINGWIDDTSDNTIKRVYGGDLLGNLWRFDIDNLVAPNQAAMLLASFRTNAATPQPITSKPVLTEVAGKPVVAVGTGQYLEIADSASKTQQSIYALKDPLTAIGWGDVRASSSFVQQTLTLKGPAATATGASVTDVAVDWTTKAGWWVDLPQGGERVIVDPRLQFTTLAVASAIPDNAACTVGGASWLYYFNVANGGKITTDEVTGELWSATSLIAGMNWIRDSSGTIQNVVQGTNGEIRTQKPRISSIAGAGAARRSSWRELAD